MESGDLQKVPGGSGLFDNQALESFAFRFSGGWLRENHGLLISFMNEAVEIAKLPPGEQPDKFQALNTKAAAMRGMRTALATMMMPAVAKVVDAYHRSQADLRCAVAALALERYRQANKRWPDSLDQLVPKFLSAVPVDPYDRKALRYKRLSDGALVYSVGPDGNDDGGNYDRRNYAAPGTDIGFQLWDVDKRRQPAPSPKQEADKADGEKNKR
jgi:hypothetical protein